MRSRPRITLDFDGACSPILNKHQRWVEWVLTRGTHIQIAGRINDGPLLNARRGLIVKHTDRDRDTLDIAIRFGCRVLNKHTLCKGTYICCQAGSHIQVKKRSNSRFTMNRRSNVVVGLDHRSSGRSIDIRAYWTAHVVRHQRIHDRCDVCIEKCLNINRQARHWVRCVSAPEAGDCDRLLVSLQFGQDDDSGIACPSLRSQRAKHISRHTRFRKGKRS